MLTKPKRYLCIEQPDQTATIDFLPYNPAQDVAVAGCTVKLELVYNPHTQSASLHVLAQDADTEEIMIDMVLPVSVSEV